MKNQFKEITALLPKGWKEAARSERALCRKGRYIKTPEDLLKVNLLYLTEGKTFGQTSALLKLSGRYPLAKNAVYERVTDSADWLKWMCEHLCHEKGFISEKPEWLENYNVYLVDATNESVPGSNRTDYRLHYLVELFHLNMVEMHFTSGAEGETITRYQTLGKNDLVIGDRAYGTIRGINYVRKQGADYLFRMKASAFKLYTAEHEEFDLEAYLKDWSPRKVIDLHLHYKSGKEYHPIRICAIGKTQEEIEKSTQHIKTSNTRNMRGKVSDLQAVFNRFVVVMTSLPDSISAEQILELYRMRWQIELIFKRFKSIFELGELTAFKEKTVQAWFYGKLLLSAVCEILAARASFPPADP